MRSPVLLHKDEHEENAGAEGEAGVKQRKGS